MPSRPEFSVEEQAKIVNLLTRELQEDVNDRADWLQKRTNSIEDWMVPDTGTVNYPWDDASNITPPIIPKAVRTVYPRIVNAFFGADPFAHLTPIDPAANRDDAIAREQFINYAVKNEIPDFQREISVWILDHIIHGTAVLMVWWEHLEEMMPLWKIVDGEIPNPVSPEEMIRLSDRMILDEEFISEENQRYTARPLGNHTYSVKYMKDGYEKEARVVIDRNEEGLRKGQVSLTIEETRISGRARVRCIDAEDIITPASATGVQPEQAHHVFRPHWQYLMDLEDRRDAGEFFNLTDEDLATAERLIGEPLEHQSKQPKEARDAVDGVDFVYGLSGVENKMVRVVETYHPWKVNGKTVEMIFHWIPALKKLAGWEYLSAKFRHGKRPLVIWQFLPVPNRMYGIGLADLLRNVQQEAKVIFNQMNNREDLINNPTMLIEQNAGVNPNVFRQLPPGSTVTVRNVERVRPLEWGKDPHSGIPLLQQLFAFGEQLAGVGDIQQGVQPNRPNAPRTARGTLALISEGNIILDQHVMQGQAALSELLFMIDSLYAQFMPPEIAFTITGKQETNTITREQFQNSVKYYFTGNTVNTNSQQQQGVAQLIYQNLAPTPFFTGEYLNMPPTAIMAQYRLIDHFAKMHLPGKDASFVLPPLEELLQTAQEFQQAQAQALNEQRAAQEEAALDLEDRAMEVEEAKATTGMLDIVARMQDSREQRSADERQAQLSGAQAPSE